MSKAVITIQDNGDQVRISAEFGEGGIDEGSYAHFLAAQAMTAIMEHHSGEAKVNTKEVDDD